MIFHFSVFLAALAFALGLEAAVFAGTWQGVALMFIATIMLYASKKIGGRFALGMVPSIFALSVLTLSYLADAPSEKQGLVVLSACVAYLAFLSMYRLRWYRRDKTAEALASVFTMITMFCFLSATYGVYLNFAVPIWGLMAIYGAGTAAVSHGYFSVVIEKRHADRSAAYSLILGLFLAELAWVANFWPFGYLTTGAVLLLMYYSAWDMARGFFFEEVSRTRAVTQAALLACALGIVLSSTRWLPTV
jgi:hypothetical protein